MPLGHYSPTNLLTGSTIPAADSHAKCGIVTPRGARLAGIVNIYIAGSSMPAAVSFYVVILAILVTIVSVIKNEP